MQQRAITRRGILLLAGALLLVLLPGAAHAQDAALREASSERPNIVLILADDLGYSDISPYGAARIETPRLQQLAEGGMRLTQMLNTSKCFTTRAQLLAGAYAQQVGMSDGPDQFENAVMLGEVLRRTGYRTLFVGKHHGTDNPYRWGFDHYYGLRDGAANYFNPGKKRPFDPGAPAQKGNHYPRTFVFDDSTAAPYTPPEDYYATDTWTTWALDLLKEREGEEWPFFLYLSYQAPHDPLQAPPETIQKYEGAFDDGYAAVRQARYERLTGAGLIDADTYPLSEATHRDWDSLSDSTKADQARRMEVYAAMIDRLDQNIGRVVDYLEARGELENTLILFASDNGASSELVRIGDGPIGSMTRWASLGADWANVGNTPFRYYKNYSYQGGIATPFIAYWPGVIAPGTTSDYVGRLLDVMPTLVEITGATYPETYRGEQVVEMQGRSLVPLFKGETETRRNGPLYWKWADGRAVYRDGWKLVAEGDSSAWALYDLEGDRTETRDLAPRSAPLVDDLARSWQAWEARTAPPRRSEDAALAVKGEAGAAGASSDSAAAEADGQSLSVAAQAQPGERKTENVILVTLDGLRWQEVFTGADSVLLRSEDYVAHEEPLAEQFWRSSPEARREALMPFFWNTIAGEGQLYGNRRLGCTVDVTNGMVFSYPGYNEILTGRADDARITSNDKVPNPNETVLEFVNDTEPFQGRVAAFGSWDVFPYIINEKRSGVPVNAGFEEASEDSLTAKQQFLNEMLHRVPSPWAYLRLDAFTQGYAVEYLKKHHPRLLYVAYGETDDFAHGGNYEAYLKAAHRTDGFIRELWTFVQSHPQYRDKTTLLITTDHGRGVGEAWTGHGRDVEHAGELWMAVLGPDAPPRGEVASCKLYQNQVAQTVAALLGLQYKAPPGTDVGAAVDGAFK